ncbi:TadE family protein [Salinisphaera sp. T31B1]|uniref:TadE/TadG family type IV pilus assembly protein n=1 Tax=Salinisphaera sp. T31B1 TaxID=727963 RepID=UPI00334295A7
MRREVDRNGRQRGAALIEFALVLPLLLAIAVGIVYYGYAFVLRSALEEAARNAVQEAVAVDPLRANYSRSLLLKRAQDVARASVDWLPASVRTAITVTESANCANSNEFGVEVTLPAADTDNQVLPQLDLGSFRIPPLPTTIRAVACAVI